jgi:undecaprenyl-diphosphatase
MHDIFVSIILGIVEGLTEFLPVSSTGHLILAGNLLDFTGPKADTFEIVIQLGAILAVAIIYWKRILGLFGLLKKQQTVGVSGRKLNLIHVILAMMPALLVGFFTHDFIKSHLFSPTTVLLSLVLGGVFMIIAEKKQPPVRAKQIDDISYAQAFGIGLIQCLALWPGFSRSGATIAGGMLLGTSVRAAADFTFLIAIPMMVAASGYDLLKSWHLFQASDLPWFATGFVVSFIVAYIAVVGFLKLLERVKLSSFAYYRFIVAAVFFILTWVGIIHI